MNATEQSPQARQLKLFPHQSALLDRLLDPTSQRVFLLISAAGLGKSTTLIAAAERFLDKQPRSKILFLAPAAHCTFVAERLEKLGVQSELVDRYRFRELQDSKLQESISNEQFWPSGVVSIMSPNFASQSDIGASLIGTDWDFVIADEVHSFRGFKKDSLRQVISSAPKVLFASVRAATKELLSDLPLTNVATVDWGRDEILKSQGNLSESVRCPELNEIPVKLTNDEIALRNEVKNLGVTLRNSKSCPSLYETILFQNLASSTSALENALRSISESISHRNEFAELLSSDPDDNAVERLDDQVDAISINKIQKLIGSALQKIEELDSESKLIALWSLLDRLVSNSDGTEQVCILTDYVATLYLLAAELENQNLSYTLLNGSMSAEERARALSRLSSQSGLLLATSATVSNIDTFREVTDLVLYDFPSSELTLTQIVGHFDRVGRSRQLRVYAFVPSTTEESYEFDRLGSLRQIIRGEDA